MWMPNKNAVIISTNLLYYLVPHHKEAISILCEGGPFNSLSLHKNTLFQGQVDYSVVHNVHMKCPQGPTIYKTHWHSVCLMTHILSKKVIYNMLYRKHFTNGTYISHLIRFKKLKWDQNISKLRISLCAKVKQGLTNNVLWKGFYFIPAFKNHTVDLVMSNWFILLVLLSGF